MKKNTVEITVNLGDLKPAVLRAAKQSGVGVNEFICNAIESRVRCEREDYGRAEFVRHGGKHLMGKRTGYEVTGDGKYYPAPSWTQQFEQLFAERNAIYNLVNTLIAQAQERLVEVEKQIIKTKESLIDDLGLDQAKQWAYYGGGRGYLEESKAKESDTEEK
jgi:biotin carboxylase